MFPLEICYRIAEFIRDPNTFISFLVLDKSVFNVIRKLIPLKKKQFLKHVVKVENKIKEEYYAYPNGRIHGIATISTYGSNGQVVETITIRYRNGIKHGKVHVDYVLSDSHMYHTDTYCNGVKHGIEEIRYGGIIGSRKWYNNGIITMEKKWHPDTGLLEAKHQYKNGELHGEQSYYNRKGMLYKLQYYVNGEECGYDKWCKYLGRH